jgi:hypothetical protein
VGEHHDLEAIIWHVCREIAVAVYHAPAEALVRACDGKSAFAVGIPVGEQRLERPFIPSEEKLGEFVVIDSVGVWRISNPNIIRHAHISSIFTSGKYITMRSEKKDI